MLRIVQDSTLLMTPYHVQTARGVTLASFKTKALAEAYRRSALLERALSGPETVSYVSDRRAATEEETLS